MTMVVCIYVYVLFCNGIWVCADVCCISSVIACGLFVDCLCSGVMDVVCLSDL